MSNSAPRAGGDVPAGVVVAIAGLVLCLSAGCAQPVSGTGRPASTATTPRPPVTVVPSPSTVYVPPPATVTVSQTPARPLTPCQRLRADGYSYEAAYSAWVQAGYPPNWDADHDGFPCEQSYGEQN